MQEIDALDMFLNKKRIDATAFRLAMPGMYEQFEQALQQGGNQYLDNAKKFQWNELRLEFPWGVDGLKKD